MTKDNIYGLRGTALWFLLIAGVFLIIQTIILTVFAVAVQPNDGSVPSMEQMESIMLGLQFNGNVVAWTVTISGVACTILTFLAIKLKKPNSISTYLGFLKVDKLTYIKWGVIFSAVLLASEGLSVLLEKDSMPKHLIDIYQSASHKWFLWVAFVLVAPIFEEIFFRGFLFRGLANSFFGTVGAIIITSAIWASIHLQYDDYYIGMIFTWGLIFGYVRHKTNSIFIPVFLHMMANSIAVFQGFYMG
jgi:membrane protease YdiL (CAAX protease family)